MAIIMQTGNLHPENHGRIEEVSGFCAPAEMWASGKEGLRLLKLLEMDNCLGRCGFLLRLWISVGRCGAAEVQSLGIYRFPLGDVVRLRFRAWNVWASAPIS